MPTRFVTLMNPRPRRGRRRMPARGRGGRFLSRRSRRRYHANPSRRARRRRVVTRTRTVYRTRRVTRRRVSHRRRRVHANPSHSPAMRRKISLAVRRSFRSRALTPRRSGGGVSRSSRRRSGGLRRSSFGGGSLMSSFRSALSRPLLMKAGGAVLASFGTGLILNKFGAKLPFANNQYGRILYTLGIPVAAAFAIRRKSRDLAEGLVIGGLVMTINTLMQGFRPMITAATGGAVGAYAVAGELGQGSFGYYPQSVADTQGLGGSNIAFPASAWG